ncbi:hypothetical protein A0H81_05590 [Grifola frondosa]|uniref:Uncharacterized protein n=1 Tax=Grifola frondosa TaxID=5627 RepID=A0A1C7MBS8_GRIFR|nr:hypothetical protein A0H81_05590 [Grifola frondosa]
MLILPDQLVQVIFADIAERFSPMNVNATHPQLRAAQRAVNRIDTSDDSLRTARIKFTGSSLAAVGCNMLRYLSDRTQRGQNSFPYMCGRLERSHLALNRTSKTTMVNVAFNDRSASIPHSSDPKPRVGCGCVKVYGIYFPIVALDPRAQYNSRD